MSDSSSNLSWWREARFGLSLHLGLYTVAARGEWVRAVERMSAEEYQRYFDNFNPEPGWAAEWARLAHRSGARYGVLTTKHHDGFCLFDSALTEFKATNTPARRDLVREWVEAMRKEGLKVGLYYSLVDWNHPDCPAAGDRQHPLRHHADAPTRDVDCNWARYVEYFHGQILELCTNYGHIDQLVVDFSYWDYQGEKWGAADIQRKVRALQPHITFNDRWANEPRKRLPRPPYAGDYEQTEQNIPREGLRDDAGNSMPWEAWFTLTNSWSYSATDNVWKSPTVIIRALVNCVSKDGNLLLNVCTDARGGVPEKAKDTLREIGDWLRLNGDSIYGAGPACGYSSPEWGRYTLKGTTLYAHVLEQVIGNICLPGMRGRVKEGRLLANNAEVIICDFWNPGIQTFDAPDDIFFNFAAPTAHTYLLPDSRDTVVSFQLAGGEERIREMERLSHRLQSALERKPI